MWSPDGGAIENEYGTQGGGASRKQVGRPWGVPGLYFLSPFCFLVPGDVGHPRPHAWPPWSLPSQPLWAVPSQHSSPSHGDKSSRYGTFPKGFKDSFNFRSTWMVGAWITGKFLSRPFCVTGNTYLENTFLILTSQCWYLVHLSLIYIASIPFIRMWWYTRNSYYLEAEAGGSEVGGQQHRLHKTFLPWK